MTSDGPQTCRVYYSGSNLTKYFDCAITRWDESNDSLVIETILTSGNRNTLFSHTIPGAVSELYSILGKKKFIDTSYSSSNTIIVSPTSGYGLSSLRQQRIIGVKNIQDTFLVLDKFSVKVEGIIL